MKKRSPVTTHILDLARGKPASGIPVAIFRQVGATWTELGRGQTDADGRVENLLATDHSLAGGSYRILFETQSYFDRLKVESFYPEVMISFQIRKTDEHYHVPLLISPFGYSTYRGS